MESKGAWWLRAMPGAWMAWGLAGNYTYHRTYYMGFSGRWGFSHGTEPPGSRETADAVGQGCQAGLLDMAPTPSAEASADT
jgi:hypothetical protein